jgi:hypothetical protein
VRHHRFLSKPLSNAVASLLILVGTALFLLGPVLPAWAGESHAAPGLLQDAVTVSLDPPDADLDVDDTVDMDVLIEDVTDLYYFDLYVTFDPDVLEVVDADSAEDGVQIEAGDFLGSDATVWANDADQEDGEIIFSQEVSTDAVSGSGKLATISFRGKVPGTSDITIDEDLLFLEDEAGEVITATIESGSITVTGDVTPTVTSEATQTPTPEETSVATVRPTFTPRPATTEPPTDTPVPTSRPTSAPEPTSTPEPTESIEARTMQLWPDRRVGVSSGLLADTGSHADEQILPFGLFDLSGESVEARTYLHFPIDTLPLGTHVKQATLHVYVDSGSGTGAEEFGVYRVLEPWSETGWTGAPASWPELLLSPMAITEVDLEAEAALPGTRGRLKLARVIGDSPLPTPPISLLPTPSSTSKPTPEVTTETTGATTPTPTAGPTTTPDATQAPPTLALNEMTGRWIVWDVTALVRGWVLNEVDDYGLALALAPGPEAGPDAVGNLLLARLLSADDPNTVPHIIADIEIHPVTPTPTPTPIPLLPPAGSRTPTGWGGIIISLVGVVLLVMGLGLVLRRRVRG